MFRLAEQQCFAPYLPLAHSKLPEFRLLVFRRLIASKVVTYGDVLCSVEELTPVLSESPPVMKLTCVEKLQANPDWRAHRRNVE